MLLKKYVREKFAVKDKFIQKNNHYDLTIGKKYEIIEAHENSFWIKDDENNRLGLAMSWFILKIKIDS